MNGWRNLVLVAAIGACVAAQGGWFAKRRVETLVVTGNFAKSRLLAELFQEQTKQPIVLISPEGVGRDQLYFLPSAPEAMMIEPTKYAGFIDFLHPSRIVFLGDAAYVPAAYIDQVRGRYSTVVLNSRDPLDNAKALGVLINDKGLAKRYASYFEKLDVAVSGQAVGADRLTAPAAAEPVAEPAALPQLVAPVQQ